MRAQAQILCLFFFVASFFSACAFLPKRDYAAHAQELLVAQDYGELIRVATHRLGKSDLPRLQFYRGCAYFSTGQYALALDDFNAIREVFVDDPFYYLNRGHVLMMNGRYKDARGVYTRAVSLFTLSEYSESFVNLSLVLPIEVDCVDSFYYTQLADFQQYLAYMYYVIALSFEKQGDRDKYAMKHYTLAIDTEKSFYPAFYRRAQLYIQHNAFQIALDDLAFLERSLERAEIEYLKAQAYSGMKRMSQALRSINKALERDPQQEYYLQRARIYEQMGRTSDAADDWERGAQLGTETSAK